VADVRSCDVAENAVAVGAEGLGSVVDGCEAASVGDGVGASEGVLRRVGPL
jgi:hypothetical protein